MSTLAPTAMVRDPLNKDTSAPVVTDKIVGENATCMTDNRRRYHRQGQALQTDRQTERETVRERDRERHINSQTNRDRQLEACSNFKERI